MNLITPAPPARTGSTNEDIAALYEWCTLLRRQLAQTLLALDSGNITGITAEKLSLGGGLTLSAPNGDYIRMDDTGLHISASSVRLTEAENEETA